MAYTISEARQELLDTVAQAANELGFAGACLAEAYEQLDERNADRLEEDLFGPVQLAYGRAKAAHAGFAERAGLPSGPFESASPGIPSTGAKGFIDNAVAAVAAILGSMLGLGGGVFLVPILTLFFGIDPKFAVGASFDRRMFFSFAALIRAVEPFGHRLDVEVAAGQQPVLRGVVDDRERDLVVGVAQRDEALDLEQPGAAGPGGAPGEGARRGSPPAPSPAPSASGARRSRRASSSHRA